MRTGPTLFSLISSVTVKASGLPSVTSSLRESDHQNQIHSSLSDKQTDSDFTQQSRNKKRQKSVKIDHRSHRIDQIGRRYSTFPRPFSTEYRRVRRTCICILVRIDNRAEPGVMPCWSTINSSTGLPYSTRYNRRRNQSRRICFGTP